MEVALNARVSPTHEGKYLHWDRLRYYAPPKGLTHEEWWCALKLARSGLTKEVPLVDVDGGPFAFGAPDPVGEHLHHIDQDAGGQIEMADRHIGGSETRDRYIINSLVEEAITSSQLEGASTTRRVAKQMIRMRRSPRDRSETMIVNNYYAMEMIRQLTEQPLTKEMLLELHLILTAGTLRDTADEGRFRRPNELVRVYDYDNEVLHDPPLAEELPRRLAAMVDFANGKTPGYFVHPVIRAILLHFWLAYDHPFVDGNGRCARALFYWSMLRQGYWLCEFVSISRIIKKAPAKYGRAFLYTETDENDLTHFILYHLEVIRQGIRSLHRYVARKTRELSQTERLMRASARFNARQLALLTHALRHADAEYSIGSHQRSHRIVHQTARTDLYDLVDRGLLIKRKIGRTFYFHPIEDLETKLKLLK